MSVIEEIEKMQQAGMSEQEIALSLQQRGLSQQQIENAFSQAQIKEAVTSDPAVPLPSSPSSYSSPSPSYSQPPDYPKNSPQNTLQASIMQSPQEFLSQEAPAPEQEWQQTPQEDQQFLEPPQQFQEAPQETYGSPYQQYAQYPQAQLSSDTITEIAEQVVSEKLSSIRNKLEKTIELKTETETKLTSLNERLQRIEKIIDRLELSILQKVGEYASNVSDLKKELIETQKSFKAVSSKSHSSHPQNPQQAPARKHHAKK